MVLVPDSLSPEPAPRNSENLYTGDRLSLSVRWRTDTLCAVAAGPHHRVLTSTLSDCFPTINLRPYRPVGVGTASSPRSDAAVRQRRSLSRRLPPANNR